MKANATFAMTAALLGPCLLVWGVGGGGCASDAAGAAGTVNPGSATAVLGSQPEGDKAAGYAEPTIPTACVTLSATKTAVNGTLSDADEAAADTDRIQEALTNCPPGQAVRLAADGAKDAFMAGPIAMPTGSTLWIDRGATLFASRNPRDFDIETGACGTDEFDDSGGCRPLIGVDTVEDVAIVGEGTIDGRGGEPMIGGTATWWDVAQHAKKFRLKHSNPRLIDIRKAKNFTLYKVNILNSPKFHVVINAKGFVVWGITMITPSRRTNSQGRPLDPHYARNTDGVDPSAASNGVIAYNYISVGDDQIAIKGGNSGATEYVTIAHNHFGTGHGMSIGSETNGGVNNILVYDLSIDGTIDSGNMPKVDLNGIRIKSDSSRGGVVEKITYRDVCILDMVNPILISPHYSKASGTMIPNYRDIVLQNVHAMRTPGTTVAPPVVTLKGYDADHLLDVTLDNVVIDGLSPTFVKAEMAEVTLGPNAVSFPVAAGPSVKVINNVKANPGGSAPPNPCTGKFVKFPFDLPTTRGTAADHH